MRTQMLQLLLLLQVRFCVLQSYTQSRSLLVRPLFGLDSGSMKVHSAKSRNGIKWMYPCFMCRPPGLQIEFFFIQLGLFGRNPKEGLLEMEGR